MFYFDRTKTIKSRHSSGLTRVSHRLLEELQPLLGEKLAEVWWDGRRRQFRLVKGRESVEPGPGDTLLTPELFDETLRPGFGEFLERTEASTAALFHDAIPLRHPEFTWPQSVARHPFYMKMLALFDKVLTVSASSGVDLAEYWDWLRLGKVPSLHTLRLGANFRGDKRIYPAALKPWSERHQILCVGILEPRKNQSTALEALSFLWKQSFEGGVAIVGRVNPHFGEPIRKTIKALTKKGFPITYHGQVGDEELQALYRESRFTLFPSVAEGCGLPVLESLWSGVPVVANPIPSVRESATEGGCHFLDCNHPDILGEGLLQIWDDQALWERLDGEIAKRDLPTWGQTAQEALRILEESG